MDKNAWHEQCILRDDVRQGTLELSEFAADLYAVRTGDALNVYRVPDLFFDRTYAPHNLKKLVRDVLLRLTGKGGPSVINVQVAYGGGKTHALIALLHLAEHGAELQTHPIVQEFMRFSGLDTLPRARVAILPFDKFDVKAGLEVVSPDGKKRWVKTPWGALAYQLAGDEGLKKIAEHETDYIAPTQPLLTELLKAPRDEDLSTLILLDEALMYMRNAVIDDPNRLGIFQDFFQGLTQAVASVDRTAIVASLLSFDKAANDPTGTQVLSEIGNIFQRVRESVEPVDRKDVSELLRRRLFEYIPPEKERRAVVNCLVESMKKLPLRASQKDSRAANRLLESYPFHPDLIEVFYQKWTQLTHFQRTRGVLRTFAIALREADGKDISEFIGPTTLLGTDGELSEVIRELVGACDEGTQWPPILTGELERARAVQKELPLLKSREIEAAVIATFLHSQPIGQKAELADLYLLLAHADIDVVSVDKGLSEWRAASWFLKENKDSWALGTNPNLTNMHFHAMRRVTDAQISEDLVKCIRDAKLGRTVDRMNVHTLPQASTDIPDTPELRFVLAAPEYAAVPGEEVSESLAEFFKSTYRNNVIILAPEKSRLLGLQGRIRKILGWQNIESGDDMDLLSEPQKALLLQRKKEDEADILESVISAYSVLIAVDEDGDIKASLLPPGRDSAFERVKAALVDEERLLTTVLDPELLTPESYFDLWGDRQTEKPAQVLYSMFGSMPRLPRLLNWQVFVDTLRRGVAEGRIVLRIVRPDTSLKTYWREPPPAADTDADDFWKKVEIVPIEHAELHNLSAELLRPGQLSEVWPDDSVPTTIGVIRGFFDGDEVPKLVSDDVLLDAIQDAVQNGLVMARHQGKAYLKEKIPDTDITDDTELLTPLVPISGSELTHKTLPDVWENDTTSLSKIMDALAVRKGTPIPWPLIREAVSDGISNNLFEFSSGSPVWPCSAEEADKVGLKVLEVAVPVKITPAELIGQDAADVWASSQPTLESIKAALESKRGVSIPEDVFREAVDRAIESGIIVREGQSSEDWYKTKVRRPAWLKRAESHLTGSQIQDLAETVGDLLDIAPELDFKFRISITAEGEPPSDEVLEQVNAALQKVADPLKFETA